jgi:hypothetical protein
MPSNRLTAYLSECRSPRFSFEFAGDEPTNPQQAFVACPVALVPVVNGAQMAWQTSIYRLAYEQALAAVAARQQARDAASPWN